MAILGGTGEARALAAELHARPGIRVVSTLAGRVRAPRLPAGEVRIGGFGGPDGLAGWLRAERVTAMVDATHPFAERISASAAEAARRAGVPIVVLRRPGWTPGPGDDWRFADDLAHAARLIPPNARVFLTTGRQGLAAFAAVEHAAFLIRCVDPPDPPLPPDAEVILARGPYTEAGELALLRAHKIGVLVTKDSGGAATVAKLSAARTLGLPVIVVRRPPAPDLPTVATVAAALSWLDSAAG
ncbi:MAG TPA: cobalt-precorrin-6A reductase [Actinophytocola sp.]|uniref:cobalt-precorrin-6A reductase n=1 Tax=Actinophytocola sp. TaxID=1872138 RepID=UPI002DBE5BCD|nr:cobalt-precorrin-6A reductase [Actinophytocola sp.]HEU5470557.1 cobalt-precorrin-6A reductase [Actinophytocola sp.]